MLAEQQMKVVRDQIFEDKIRKGASREMCNEIYKPITESQKETLSTQLKELPGIKEQLALLTGDLDNKIRQAEQQQKSLELLEKPVSRTLPPPIKPVGVEVGVESLQEEDNEAENLGARPKEFKLDLNKNVDVNLLGTKKYFTPQEVFDFYHSTSNNPDEK